MTASGMRLTPYHFRDQQMHEVDIVLERDDGTIAGIEIKASATVTSSDFAGADARRNVQGSIRVRRGTLRQSRSCPFWRQAGGGADFWLVGIGLYGLILISLRTKPPQSFPRSGR